jgi:serine/threonine-protein kinase SRPK3
MVFEILGVNLLEVLKRYDYKGLPLDLVKEISRQVLMGLDFLNRICRVIHTDLKPENVLLCLTEQEMKQIVEKGQLSNKELYRDRLRLYREKYHLGPTGSDDEEEDEPQAEVEVKKETNILPKEVNSEEDEDDPFNGELSSLSTRISEIKERLDGKDLNKTQRKNLRRKLKKFEEKAS